MPRDLYPVYKSASEVKEHIEKMPFLPHLKKVELYI